MQCYARLRPEAEKCVFRQKNPKLTKESVRDLYTLEKLLEEAPLNKEGKANELEITAKETQDAGKQGRDADANRVKV